MTPANLLIIMVDEMSAKTVGCYGHRIVKTPNIDYLAARGTRFAAACSTSPICMPARACFATGRYPHETGYWDNVFAYDGRVPSWGHRLQATGHRVTSIGKLHYIREDDPVGIDEQILPMHRAGIGDVYGLMRGDPPVRSHSRVMAESMGPGDSDYTDYDVRITEATEDWLVNRAGEQGDKPWVCFVSYIAPHYPLIAPQKYFDLYAGIEMPAPKQRTEPLGPNQRWWDLFERCYCWDKFFQSPDHRREAIRSYFALSSFADDNVGRVVRALERSGQSENTRVLFLSDHGENLGARNLWGKSTMYAEAVSVPMILAGPGVPAGKVCRTPVGLVDCYPSILQCVGEEPSAQDRQLPGESLFGIAARDDDLDRVVFSEYHASCATSGLFMLRSGRWKYIHYTGFEPELFDLEADPEELTNLAKDPDHADVLKAFESRLFAMLDPQAVDRRAKADQAERLEELGGAEAILAQGDVSYTPAPS